MSQRYKLTPEADHDLVEIWRYTQSTWAKQQANAYLNEFEKCFYKLTENPELGTIRDDIRLGYRCLPKNKHLIFYRFLNRQIEIVRILHERMDTEGHL